MLEGLCSDVGQQYQLSMIKPKIWQRTDWMQKKEMRDKWKTDPKIKAQKLQLQSHCDALVEEHEDTIYKTLMAESDSPPDLKTTIWYAKNQLVSCPNLNFILCGGHSLSAARMSQGIAKKRVQETRTKQISQQKNKKKRLRKCRCIQTSLDFIRKITHFL
eukprot:SAG31_NODE_2705_length_5215_cov_9.452502_2_plen_160_part_00